MTATIALFTYSRPVHTKRTIEALRENFLASESDLIIYSDAAKTREKQSAVDEVRAYLGTITGFRTVTIRHRMENYGLAKSIIQGVTEVLHQSERVVVLEDDLVTSPYFLTYMNDALERFATDERVASIHGYVYPVKQQLPEAFFLRGADCWGWATWRHGWSQFNPDSQYLLDELKKRNLISIFDFNGAYSYSEMLADQAKGKNDSWAIRWHASTFLADMLTLYPNRSLVHNIGNDNSGTHCGNSSFHDTKLSQTPIDLNNIEVKLSEEGFKAFEKHFKRSRNSLFNRIVRLFH